jgi:CHAT domain-containing protein/Tfp pilus assembly protein PilF
VQGPKHIDVGAALNDLGNLYRRQGRTREAEPLYKRAVVIFEEALGKDHPILCEALNGLAAVYHEQGRYAEAERLFSRSLAISEKAQGPYLLYAIAALGGLAAVHCEQGRYGDAEPLYKRTISMLEKARGPDHPDVGSALSNLAGVYREQGRTAEAEPLYKRSLAIAEKALGPDHPDVAATLNNLAGIYREHGRTAQAEPLYKRSLAISEKALGPEHPDVGSALNNLGLLYSVQGRAREAEPLYKRALVIREKALGPEHPWVATTLSNLGALYSVQRDWARAADFWRRSTAVIIRRAQRGTDDVGQGLTGTRKSEPELLNWQFWALVKVVHRIASEQRGADAGLPAEMFATAQWASASQAAQALAQMAARGAKGDAALSRLIRERQDLVVEWQRRDAARTAAVSQAPDKRDRAAEAANVARLVAIDTRIAEIDQRLKAEFPDYAAFSRPEPLSVEEVQAELRADEALVLFLDTPESQPTPEETFIWVVTKTDMRWVRSELGTPALAREVAALRCGLDASLWDDETAANRCRAQLTKEPSRDRYGNVLTETLPFDHAHAHKLYNALLKPVEDLIKGKHLLVIPSGPLTQLPFQVLVTDEPARGKLKSAAWLAGKHALTVLPSVSSLKALRRVAKPSAATKPMIGFGNPLLNGDQGHPVYGPYYRQQAQLARTKTGCQEVTGQQRVAFLRGSRGGVAAVATRGGRLANVAHLRAQSPLPETADELCAVARHLGADPRDMLMGARASEREVKALSEKGVLAQYRVVHFATHGAVAGQLIGTTEPGLILTPPDTATPDDDGYLSASEVAGLKLDADWVILSACNTAAGGVAGADALSGLARAFFYAQARALLVSHWAVESEPTVKLITGVVGAMTRDRSVGRAEALHRAMLALIESGKPEDAHPAYWAPFVLVGEGAAAR